MSTRTTVRRAERAARSVAADLVRRARPLVGPASLQDPPYGLRRTGGVVVQRAVTPYVPLAATVSRLPRVGRADLVAVYRERNAAVIGALAAEVTGTGALWALDAAHPALAAQTVGVGAGSRFVNLNRLLPPADDATWLVVADDDVRLSSGSLSDALALAAAAGLDVAMPSHDRDSFVNWSVTRCRPQSLVRLTRFIDQGPLLILSPLARRRLLPFDETIGMGWGAELAWGADTELRIGVLDGVRMQHLSPVSRTAYDVEHEWDRALQALDASPWSSWAQAQAELGRWSRWQSAPPWLARPVT